MGGLKVATNRTIDENTDTQKKSAEPVTRVPKFSTIIAGIIVMVILVCMALAFSDGSSTEKLQQYLKNKEYSNAVQFYNKKVNGNEKREKEVNPLFSSSVEGIFFDFQEDEISYEEIIRIYEELVKVENQELAELTALKIEEVNEFQESREIFETGVGLLETREYISALETFAKIEKSPYYYAQVQEQMERCVEDIVRSVSDKTDMENIKDSFEIIKKALKILPGNDSLTKCQTELGANFKKNLFEQTEKLVQAGDYAGVFSAIKKAMNVFSDADILAKKEQYESDFELKMVEEVNDFVNKGQYAEALKVIEDALKVMNSNTLKNLKNDIQAKQAEVKEKEAQHISEKVDFVTCEGSINGADEVHTYSLTAPETGSYRFFLKDMKNGFTVKLYVYKSDGAEITGELPVN